MRPRKNNLHQLMLKRLDVLVLVYRQFTLLRHFGNDARLRLDFAKRPRKLVFERGGIVALLLKDETAENRCALLGGELIEESIEEELAEKQLVAGADFACHPRL